MLQRNYDFSQRKRWEMEMCHYLKMEYDIIHKIAQAKIEYDKKTIEKLEEFQKISYNDKRAAQIKFLKSKNIFGDINCLHDAQRAFVKYYKH